LAPGVTTATPDPSLSQQHELEEVRPSMKHIDDTGTQIRKIQMRCPHFEHHSKQHRAVNTSRAQVLALTAVGPNPEYTMAPKIALVITAGLKPTARNLLRTQPFRTFCTWRIGTCTCHPLGTLPLHLHRRMYHLPWRAALRSCGSTGIGHT